MQLHEIRPTNELKSKKPRVGRGGKRGTYSGRGQKGQKAHAGRGLRPAVRDLLMKLPKLRGYNNNPLKKKPLAVNVGDLHKIEGGVVNIDSLKKSGLIKSTRKTTVKILGKGELKKALKIENLPVSKEAQVKIEKAGGEITVAKK